MRRQTISVPDKEQRLLIRDIGAGETRFLVTRDDGWSVIDDIGTAVHYGKIKDFAIGNAPSNSRTSMRCEWGRKRADWNVRVETEVSMRCDSENFIMTGTYRGFVNETLFAERSFERITARDNL